MTKVPVLLGPNTEPIEVDERVIKRFYAIQDAAWALVKATKAHACTSLKELGHSFHVGVSEEQQKAMDHLYALTGGPR